MKMSNDFIVLVKIKLKDHYSLFLLTNIFHMIKTVDDSDLHFSESQNEKTKTKKKKKNH